MIELRHVAVVKSGRKLFQNLNWKTSEGENWLIQGANGSGKTIFLELLAGVQTPSEGEVHYDFIHGADWRQRYEQRKQLIHYISSAPALSQIHQHELFYQQRYYSLGDELVPTVKEFLGEILVQQIRQLDFPASLSVHHLLELKLTRLSNGQSKKVMLLKSLALQIPRVLILDYPFEALDRASRKELAEFLVFISKNFSVQLILSGHDANVPTVINRRMLLHRFLIKESVHFTPSVHTEDNTEQQRNDSQPANTPVVQMKELTLQYGQTTIIKNLNWTVNQGERWVVSGKNGSGKTTLFSLIFADHPMAYSQQVYLFGKRRGSGESIWDIKNRVTYLGPEQMSYLAAEDRLLTGRQLLIANQSVDEETYDHLVSYFEIADFITQPIYCLSAGQIQLIFIVRCFLFQKELLLLDEPFRFLDPVIRQRVTNYLQHHLDTATTLIMITHDDEDVIRWGAQRLML